jgi:hypothetical protein
MEEPMVRRGGFVFLGAGALSGAIAVWSTGCQGGSATTTSGSGGEGGSGSTTTSGTMSTTSAGGGTSTSTSTGSGGATDAKISDISTGKVGKVEVKLTGVVAMSKKLLISQSKTSGNCLWGVFISEPGLAETAPNSGILALGKGKNAAIGDAGTATCPPDTDPFPAGTAPGDVLDVVGTSDSYITTTGSKPCGSTMGDSLIAMFQLSNVSSATKTGTAMVPKPHVLTDAELTSFAGQMDKAFYDQWGGTRVAAQGVTATAPMGSTSIIGAFGVITLDSNAVGIADKLYYVKGGGTCNSAPSYAATMVKFDEIDGFVYLDYCTWHLAPDNKCADFKPISEDCMGNADFCK